MVGRDEVEAWCFIHVYVVMCRLGRLAFSGGRRQGARQSVSTGRRLVRSYLV